MMKTPDEVRRDLDAAREAYKTKYDLCERFGWTSHWGVNEWTLSKASNDDERWQELLEEYVKTYTMIYEDPERFSPLGRH